MSSTKDKENKFLDILSEVEAMHSSGNMDNIKDFYICSQTSFQSIPGRPMGYWANPNLIECFNNIQLNEIASPRKGNSTSDNERFLRFWSEVSEDKIAMEYKSVREAMNDNKRWIPYNKGGGNRKWYGYSESLVDWENDAEEIRKIPTSVVTNEQYYMQPGLTWSTVSTKAFGVRFFNSGYIFDNGGCCIFDLGDRRNYIAGLLNSCVLSKLVSVISPTLNYQSGDIAKMPIIFSDEEVIGQLTKESYNISKSDWDAHETSWNFKKPEIMAVDTATYMDNIQYQVDKHFKERGEQICIDPAAPELDSLEWRYNQYQSKWERLFLQLHANEEELNRRFIEIYGLQNELTPDVPLNEVTILQKGELTIDDGEMVWHPDVVMKQFISYLVGCFMGRYSVDRDGLIIASQGQDLSELELEVGGLEGSPKSTLVIDDDGIIPIVMEEEFFADDLTKRITEGIKTLFGKEHFYANMKFIEDNLGCDLRTYLHRDYYNDHLEMYSVKGAKRPIYWLFSSKMGDKRKKGWFKALVYMHRLEPDTLSKLHADYVHPYIQKTEMQLREAEEMADRDDLKPAARNKALKQVEEIRSKLREMREFETQLVEMASQRLSIDLDDGVKANYPKFYPLVEPIKGLDSKDE